MAEQTPFRFSVVCAAYNARTTVLRAVSSCLEQTHQAHEVIVVDDASTDGTPELLDETFGDRIRLIRLDKNGGPSTARNAGLAAATGDFIALQDADDWWEPEKLSRVAGVLARRPVAGFVFHRYAHTRRQLGNASARKLPGWNLLVRNMIATPCVVFRNDGAMRFDERLRWMEDWDFFLRAEERWGAWLLDEPLTVLGRPILSAGGLSAARWKMRQAEMRVYTKWASARWWRLLLLPLLWAWSAAKGVAKWFSHRSRSHTTT